MPDLPLAQLGSAGALPALVPDAHLIGGDLMLCACALIALVAVAVLAEVVSTRRIARADSRLARARMSAMHELLETVRMAETIAGIGVWQFEPTTGKQRWSGGMRALFDLDRDEELVDGDAETVLMAHDVDLVGAVMAQRDAHDPYELSFDIFGLDGAARTLAGQACNLRDAGGAVVRVLAVIRDATDQVARERALAQSRALTLWEARQARELASTDPLTGLANRRRVMAELDRMMMRARMAGQSLALIVFDLDHFKKINDTFGHLLGDKVLGRVAELARCQARDADLIGRVGGEEFVWIVPQVDRTGAGQLAERLLSTIAAGSAIDEAPAVTASVGCAQLQPGDTSLSLFARADAALYAAKNAGRNQVRLAA